MGQKTFTDSEVDCALCIFDQFVNCMTSSFTKKRENNDAARIAAPNVITPLEQYIDNVHDEGGTPAVRQLAADLAIPIEKARLANIDLVEKADCVVFDFEFIPDLLSRAVKIYETVNLTEKHYTELTAEILRAKVNIQGAQGDSEVLPEKEYRAVWTIDVSARSPQEAAEKALGYQRAPNTSATVFSVAEVQAGMSVSRWLDIDADADEQISDDTWDSDDLNAALTAGASSSLPVVNVVSLEQVVAALVEIKNHHGAPAYKNVLRKLGVAKSSELNIMDYAEALAIAKEQLKILNDAALTAGGVVLAPIGDGEILKAAEYVLSDIYTKDTGRELITVSRDELLTLKAQVIDRIDTYEREDGNDHIINSAHGCLNAISNILQLGGAASDRDFSKVNGYITFFATSVNDKQTVAPTVGAVKHEAVKREDKAKAALIAINAANAAKSIRALIHTIGEHYVDELEAPTANAIDLRAVLSDLTLIAEVWSDAAQPMEAISDENIATQGLF